MSSIMTKSISSSKEKDMDFVMNRTKIMSSIMIFICVFEGHRFYHDRRLCLRFIIIIIIIIIIINKNNTEISYSFDSERIQRYYTVA